eukprot:GHRR01002298.1.p1 GENE.GHRR01002298.1~~GHRR01002298.1.p1  ORF type:complete len:377 (+),score=117.01 GHRR01002298.1:413-1543(+)
MSGVQPPSNPDPLRETTRYTKVADLSHGSFGFVQLARNTETQELVAIKFIERGDRVNRYVEAEILNHRMLRHPHVIEFKEVFITSEYICIAMEFASGGSLFTYVQRAVRLKEAASRWFFQQLIIGLDYCHRRGVVNRDIKLENTLLQMVQGLPLPLLKICDFGYSKAHFMSAPKSKVGTLAYMAPEIIRATGNYDGKKADIWSCGVMLYVMLFGQYPFETQQPGGPKLEPDRRIRTMMDRIVNMQWSLPAGIEISAECRDLLTRMLVRNPDDRITMEEIHRHPWFIANLPVEAVSMNDSYLNDEDYSNVQSVEDIRRILSEAQTPGPNKYNFESQGHEGYEDNMIDDAIEDEMNENEQSFNPRQHQQRGVVAAMQS